MFRFRTALLKYVETLSDEKFEAFLDDLYRSRQQISFLKERDARSGKRYQEVITAHFGVINNK